MWRKAPQLKPAAAWLPKAVAAENLFNAMKKISMAYQSVIGGNEEKSVSMEAGNGVWLANIGVKLQSYSAESSMAINVMKAGVKIQ
jgi:hypothetical protein